MVTERDRAAIVSSYLRGLSVQQIANSARFYGRVSAGEIAVVVQQEARGAGRMADVGMSEHCRLCGESRPEHINHIWACCGDGPCLVGEIKPEQLACVKRQLASAKAELERVSAERDSYRDGAAAEARRCDELLAERNRARNETESAQELAALAFAAVEQELRMAHVCRMHHPATVIENNGPINEASSPELVRPTRKQLEGWVYEARPLPINTECPVCAQPFYGQNCCEHRHIDVKKWLSGHPYPDPWFPDERDAATQTAKPQTLTQAMSEDVPLTETDVERIAARVVGELARKVVRKLTAKGDFPEKLAEAAEARAKL